MKIYREKNRVILEVEEKDCPPGTDTEMAADAMLAGMLVGQEHIEASLHPDGPPPTQEQLRENLENARADVLERWEVTDL